MTLEDAVQADALDEGDQIMKRLYNLFDIIISIENLIEAHLDVIRSHKVKKRRKAYNYADHLFKNIISLHKRLKDGTWKMHDYIMMIRNERGKLRIIYYSNNHEDLVVQHAILRVLSPLLVNRFIRDTYSSIKNRGTHDGVMRVKKYLKSIPDGFVIIVYTNDVYHYYPQINHDNLKICIRRYFKDKLLLRLLDGIIDSHDKGLPIGNPLSTLLANLFLNDIDHAAKEIFKIKGYFRYLDDLDAIFIGEDAKLNAKVFSQFIDDELSKKGLSSKDNKQIYPIERHGINFLGYRFIRTKSGKIEVRMRISTARRFRRAAIRFLRKKTRKHFQSVASYWGSIKWSTKAKKLWRRYFKVSVRKLKYQIID